MTGAEDVPALKKQKLKDASMGPTDVDPPELIPAFPTTAREIFDIERKGHDPKHVKEEILRGLREVQFEAYDPSKTKFEPEMVGVCPEPAKHYYGWDQANQRQDIFVSQSIDVHFDIRPHIPSTAVQFMAAMRGVLFSNEDRPRALYAHRIYGCVTSPYADKGDPPVLLEISTSGLEDNDNPTNLGKLLRANNGKLLQDVPDDYTWTTAVMVFKDRPIVEYADANVFFDRFIVCVYPLTDLRTDDTGSSEVVPYSELQAIAERLQAARLPHHPKNWAKHITVIRPPSGVDDAHLEAMIDKVGEHHTMFELFIKPQDDGGWIDGLELCRVMEALGMHYDTYSAQYAFGRGDYDVPQFPHCPRGLLARWFFDEQRGFWDYSSDPIPEERWPEWNGTHDESDDHEGCQEEGQVEQFESDDDDDDDDHGDQTTDHGSEEEHDDGDDQAQTGTQANTTASDAVAGINYISGAPLPSSDTEPPPMDEVPFFSIGRVGAGRPMHPAKAGTELCPETGIWKIRSPLHVWFAILHCPKPSIARALAVDRALRVVRWLNRQQSEIDDDSNTVDLKPSLAILEDREGVRYKDGKYVMEKRYADVEELHYLESADINSLRKAAAPVTPGSVDASIVFH
eukprot:Clim_evm5s148 gene=Clim_evmTU5s148